MAMQAWYDKFSRSQLHNIISHRSDHYPILIHFHEEQRRRGN